MTTLSKYKDNLITNLSFDYALMIIEFSELLREKKKYVIADQILRSGCSIGAHISQAQNAESKADFKHKMKGGAKQADENEYWLLLCKHSKTYPFNEELIVKLESVMRVLNKIISTSKRA